MVISYEIEKSFTTENYCMCSVLNNNIFEEQSYKLVYDLIDSPVDGKRRIDILLPVASRHNVARKLGATISSPKSVYSIYQHKKLTGKSSKGRESQLISRNTLAICCSTKRMWEGRWRCSGPTSWRRASRVPATILRAPKFAGILLDQWEVVFWNNSALTGHTRTRNPEHVRRAYKGLPSTHCEPRAL